MTVERLLAELNGAVADVTHDAAWLDAALARDGLALHAYCRRLAGDVATAEDLLQDTLVRALTHPPADLDRPVLPWLKAVARNLAVDAWRGRREVPAEVVEPIGVTDDTEAREQVQAALVEAVAQLGVAQLAVFLLQAMLGLSADQVAEAVGRSPGNVRVLTHRARQSVRAGGPLSDRVRREAVAEFLEQVCAARMEGLHDLMRLVRPDGEVPGGELGAALRGHAAARAWERLLSACGGLVARDDHDAAAAALWARAVALDEQGDSAEGMRVMREALQVSRARGLEAHTARALVGVATIAIRRGDLSTFDAAREDVPGEPGELILGILDGGRLWRRGDLQAATQVYARLLDGEQGPVARAALLHNLAFAQSQSGRLEEARRHGEEALALHRAAGDPRNEGRTLNALGMVAQNLGALGEAEARFWEAVARFEEVGAVEDALKVQTNLGLIAHELGDLSLAAERFERSAARAGKGGLPRSRAIALANLGVTLHADGRLRPARHRLEQALAVLAGADVPQLAAFVRAHHAAVVAWEDPDEALSTLHEARGIFVGLDDPRFTALADLLIAWACGSLAEVQRALDAARPHGRESVVVRIGAELVRRNALRRAADTPSRPGPRRRTSLS